MSQKTWNRLAPLYARAMRPDSRAYEQIYARVRAAVSGKDVLEIATGPGLFAKNIATSAKSVLATDFAPNMIEEARKGDVPANVTFQVADATALPLEDGTFDAVLMANALHVMPNPEAALKEAARVLREDGLLIVPNFVEHCGSARSRLWSTVLRLVGVRFDSKWTEFGYREFLEQNGWHIESWDCFLARTPIAYAECRLEKKSSENPAYRASM